jgi:xanthine/uracil permease
MRGSILAFLLGQCSLEKVYEAPWIAVPPIYTPEWSLPAIIILIPAFFVTLVEVISHLQVTQTIVGTNMFKDPGLFRVLVGKGISIPLSSFFDLHSIPRIQKSRSNGNHPGIKHGSICQCSAICYSEIILWEYPSCSLE